MKEEEWNQEDDVYDDHPLHLTTNSTTENAAVLEMVSRWEQEEEEEQFGSAKIVTMANVGKRPEEEDEEEKGTIFGTFEALEELAINDDDDDDKMNKNYETMVVDGTIGEEQNKDEELSVD